MLGNGKVFISHSHEDSERCQQLLAALNDWGVEYWIDNEQFRPGSPITPTIQEAIREYHVFVKLCTLAAQRRSYWLDEEYGAFKGLQAQDENADFKGRRVFIPIVMDEGYQLQPFENNVKWIKAFGRQDQEWLQELRNALGIELEPPLGNSTSTDGNEGNAHSGPLSPAPRSAAVAEMLLDMNAALADEIAAVQRYRNKHAAVDGQLLGAVEGQYLYTFTLDEPWEAQEDLPLTVEVPRNMQTSATVVTCSGTKITIAVAGSLPEEALKKVYLYDDPTRLLEALREALVNTEESALLLGSKTLGLEKYSPSWAPYPNEVPGFTPTKSQRRAVQLALGSEVAYIIGPPGTGKTATLAAIAFSHISAGRSVLICAHTNIAVDNAVLGVAKMTHGLPILADGKIVRYGAPKLEAIRESDFIYPPNIAKRRGQALERQKKAVQTKLKETLAALESGRQAASEFEAKWRDERKRLRGQLASLEAELEPLKLRENQRLRQLALHITSVERQMADAQRDLVHLRDELALVTGQRIRQQLLWEHREEQIRNIGQQIVAAQKMNGLVLLLKGINLNGLTHQMADLQYQVYRDRQALTEMDARIERGQQHRNSIEQTIARLASERTQLEQQTATPSPDARRKTELKATIERACRELEEGDARVKQISRQSSDDGAALQRDAQQLRSQLGEIDLQLAELEKHIVADAHLVATTLTKVYMGAALRDRRFDVVIIDEVSIAPLPALYVAAARADSNVTIVGDPYQLSPIVQAKTPAADKWLGQDLFTHVNVTIDGDVDKRSAFLDEQFRMHPAISIIARKHVYRDRLQDGPIPPHPEYEGVAPVPGKALVLCDTSDANPVSGPPPRGKGKLNEYHALCVQSIIRQVLRTLPAKDSNGDSFRIGIVTPYRAQATRIQRQLRKDGLDDLVRAGTIHSFQGLQFEVVIFDTVESPRQQVWFTAGGWRSMAMRLTNVAVTRPQHKLIVVANLSYLRGQLTERDTLLEAVMEAGRSAIIKSSEIIKHQSP